MVYLQYSGDERNVETNSFVLLWASRQEYDSIVIWFSNKRGYLLYMQTVCFS